MTIATKRISAIICAALTLTTAAFAQTVHKKNFIQRHPTAAAIGAGWATHHYLKVKAQHDKRAGKKLNWAERHPTLSAIGVGVATHHIIKKTTPKDAH